MSGLGRTVHLWNSVSNCGLTNFCSSRYANESNQNSFVKSFEFFFTDVVCDTVSLHHYFVRCRQVDTE